MKQDLYNQLQSMATNSVYTGQTNLDTVNSKKEMLLKDTLKTLETNLKTLYPNDRQKQFDSWIKETKDTLFPTQKFNEYYWNKTLDMHPDGREAAKENLIRRTEEETNMFQSPTEKEFFLRDKISRFPNWLTKEFSSSVQDLSFRNANSNLNKAKALYRNDLSQRLGSLSNQEIDPDVGVDEHVSDLLKLEQLNLLPVAQSFNGRFGVVNKTGAFTPAFDLQDRSTIFEKDIAGNPGINEQLLVNELSPPLIKDYVKGNLATQRGKINLDNKVAETIAGRLLDQGKLTPDKWSEAFSMFSKPDYKDLITRGMTGEIAAGRIKTNDDLSRVLYTAVNQYKDFLGDIPDATNA
ncbi:hypothetical protein UFOVP1192_15 [uncultured Caudovirales phage]|uniref:Uncharacterized protein n=1 Tax=uncultured Caudovirales phage TaxID=2100421 RepID=A0A6J5RDX7_9CAUD|nr:hypothetical protein UFOVP1192_15 [uncultured Caudovirales phage]